MASAFASPCGIRSPAASQRVQFSGRLSFGISNVKYTSAKTSRLQICCMAEPEAASKVVKTEPETVAKAVKVAEPETEGKVAKAEPEAACKVKAKPETVNKVVEVVKKQLALDHTNPVTAESSFVELGADSLDTVEIVMGLEEEFDITVEEDGSQNISTVQDAADLIEALLEEKAAA